MKLRIILFFLALSTVNFAQVDDMLVGKLIDQVESEVIEWRRHYHEHPELSNREFNTGKHIAQELRKLGLEVETGIAITGVVGVLDSGKPGPVIGLRADIDGLPVTERTPVPFASKAKDEFLGEDVGVMHACGCLLYTSPSPRDRTRSRMPSSA